MEDMGHIVHTATCGRDAMTVFRNINPMIVLMYVMLPNTNSLELLKKMRDEIPDILHFLVDTLMPKCKSAGSAAPQCGHQVMAILLLIC